MIHKIDPFCKHTGSIAKCISSVGLMIHMGPILLFFLEFLALLKVHRFCIFSYTTFQKCSNIEDLPFTTT